MKRIVILITALILCIALCGCTDGKYFYVGSDDDTSSTLSGGSSASAQKPSTGTESKKPGNTIGNTTGNTIIIGGDDGEVQFSEPVSSKPTSSSQGSTSNNSNSTSSAGNIFDSKDNWQIVSLPSKN